MKIAATSGVFDLLHVGHINLLKLCKQKGDYVVVFLNSDASVKNIKGKNRPIQKEEDRKIILESLKYVDEVVLFDEKTPSRAIFLFMRTIDFYIKSNEYKRILPEGRLVDNVIFIKKDKNSTTNILKKLK